MPASVKWIVPFLVSFLGLLVMFGGLLYFVLFAGIPSQDPSVELRASYDFHSRIADGIREAGGLIFFAGLILGVGLMPFAILRKRVELV